MPQKLWAKESAHGVFYTEISAIPEQFSVNTMREWEINSSMK